MKAGETLLVTEREEVVAEIRPGRRLTTALDPRERITAIEATLSI